MQLEGCPASIQYLQPFLLQETRNVMFLFSSLKQESFSL